MTFFNSSASALPGVNYSLNGDDSVSVGFDTGLVSPELTPTEPRSLSSPLPLEPLVASSWYLNQQVLPLARQALQQFVLADNFKDQVEIAFGEGCNVNAAQDLVENLAVGHFPFDIQAVPQSQLQADGAFGHNTLFISEELLNSDHLDRSVDVVLEEMGHFIDSQINTVDAPGDEGEIFSHLVQGDILSASQLADLKTENDHVFTTIQGNSFWVEQAASAPGVFSVNTGGKVVIDFLADGGQFQSELGVFSLEGMNSLSPGSKEFIAEASRRALSNSTLGAVVISDAGDGAKFSGQLGEPEKNSGGYRGQKSLELKAGTEFAFIFTPDGTLQEVANNPDVDLTKRPLFSWSAANPNNTTQIGQLVAGTKGGGLFGFEDLRLDAESDRDYNDLIIQVKGANGEATPLSSLIAEDKKGWLQTDLGQQLISYAKITGIFEQDAPIITVNLTQDTGENSSDRLTNNPEILGRVEDASGLDSFQLGLNGTNVFVDALSLLKPDGTFIFTKERLAEINGGQLRDGFYTLTLQASDQGGTQSKPITFDFTLDTQAPSVPTILSLLKVPLGQTIIQNNRPELTGVADANTKVQLFKGDEKVGEAIANADGIWTVTTNLLAEGSQQITAKTVDGAGNVSVSSLPFVFTVDSKAPTITLTSPLDNETLRLDARLIGQVDGTGSNLRSLSYQFDGGKNVPVNVNSKGEFDQLLDLTGVSNGTQALTLTAIDLAGNVTTTKRTLTIKAADDVTPPEITASLLSDTGSSNTDKITNNPTISGTVTDENAIALFRVKLDNGTFVDVSGTLQNGAFSLDNQWC